MKREVFAVCEVRSPSLQAPVSYKSIYQKCKITPLISNKGETVLEPPLFTGFFIEKPLDRSLSMIKM
jgi:hypothetical protein